MQKKLILPLIIALYSTLYTPYSILAVSPTPSPNPSSSPASINEVTENLKKRLQDNLGADEDTPTPISNARAYIGVVKDIIKDTVIIEDKDGKKDIKLVGDTDILRSPGSTTIKPENIRIDDYIIAIGYPDELGEKNLRGRRLILSSTPINSPSKASDMGTVVKLGKDEITVSVGGEEKVLSITSKTIFKSTSGTIEYSDLSEGDTLVYTAKVGDDDELTATHVMRTQTSALSE